MSKLLPAVIADPALVFKDLGLVEHLFLGAFALFGFERVVHHHFIFAESLLD